MKSFKNHFIDGNTLHLQKNYESAPVFGCIHMFTGKGNTAIKLNKHTA